MTQATTDCSAPFRHVEWMNRDLEVRRNDKGCVYIRSRVPLSDYPRHIGIYLTRAAASRPDRIWLAERNPADGAWRSVTYRAGKQKVDGLSQSLLDLTPDLAGPIAILSENSISHGLIAMAAMQVGIPVAPISPAYSLHSQDHAKLRHIFNILRPSLVFVEDQVRFARALDALDLRGVHLVSAASASEGWLNVEKLADANPTSAVEQASAEVDGNTIAKFLFTSGSTGMPKAVINTQRMMCANISMLTTCRPPDEHPVTLEWMPWSHTMGGNSGFNSALANAGSLYIDDGRPVPGLMDRTLRNLRDISPTTYTNVPAGFAALVSALEVDSKLCTAFFSRLKLLGYGGARLPDDLYKRIQALAIRTTGERISFASFYGATETAPAATCTHWLTEQSGLIGLPLPGVDLKLAPVDDKYELRVRGVTVTPGYHGEPELSAAAFDEENYFRTGDLVQFVASQDINEGLVFAGRLSEQFKLLTGTFVPTGTVRVEAIGAASPLLTDALVTGQDRSFVGLLAWLNLDACRRLVEDDEADAEGLACHPAVIAGVRDGLARLNAINGFSSSRCIARLIFLTDPPRVDTGEITDKGYINQHVGLQRRADVVERLYQEPPPPDVIVVHDARHH